MKRHSGRLGLTIASILMLSVTASCRSPTLGAPDATGALTIALPAASREASRAPGGLAGLAGTVSRWLLEGDGPAGRSGSWEFDAATVSAADNRVSLELLVGDWTITISGYDADGGEAFVATRSVTIAPDAENVVSLTLAWAERALVSRFSFDTDLNDEKGRMTSAKPESAGSWGPTASSASIPSLDGRGYIYIAESEYLDIQPAEMPDAFTLSVWIRPEGDTDRVILTNRQEYNGDGFTLYLSGSNALRLETDSGDNMQTADYVVANGDWNHVAAVVDSATGQASIYLNGSMRVSSALDAFSTAQPIRLGASFFEGAEYNYYGSVDDLRVYAGALSADDIAAIRADGYFSGGLGTEASPYLVATPLDLYNVRYAPGAHFRQTADIDLGADATTGAWTPISSFTGDYDGGGKRISNVALGATSVTDAGFFKLVSTGAAVRNLTIGAVSGSSTAAHLGALAGTISGATVSDVTITGIALTGTTYIGGLAGVCTNGTLTRVSVSGTIESTASVPTHLGGLAGELGGTVESCAATIDIGPADGTTSPNAQQVGGFAGWIRDASVISNCSARGNILYGGAGDGMNLGGFAGYIWPSVGVTLRIDGCDASGIVQCSNVTQVGGFAGQLYSGSGSIEIDGCASTCAVTATDGEYIGGFAGSGSIHTNGSGRVQIRSSSSSGAVTATSATLGRFVGGFIGYAKEGTDIEACYSASDVTAGTQIIGGFVGSLGSAATATGTCASVRQCYATGTAIGDNTIGGFAGAVYQASTIEDCYVNESVQPAATTNNGGFIGQVNLSYGTPSVERCYFAGELSDQVTGAFIGSATAAYNGGTTCFWHAPAAGALGNPTDVSGPNGATLDDGSDFGDWNETSALWYFDAGSFPTLAWQHE